MIQRTSFAIAVDDPRKVLNGCLMEIHSGELRIVALDGFRLGMQVSKVGEENDIGAIIGKGHFRNGQGAGGRQ